MLWGILYRKIKHFGGCTLIHISAILIYWGHFWASAMTACNGGNGGLYIKVVPLVSLLENWHEITLESIWAKKLSKIYKIPDLAMFRQVFTKRGSNVIPDLKSSHQFAFLRTIYYYFRILNFGVPYYYLTTIAGGPPIFWEIVRK